MIDPEDPRMRFRLWIAGQLVDETWVDASNPDAERIIHALRQRHIDLANEATAEDRPWLAEYYDPAKPEHEAYVRFGDDAEGMVDPSPWSP